MPIYTYRCENCGLQFERFQHFDDQPLTRCPECEHEALRKVILPVGIVFRGSGFYSTDHRSPSGLNNSKKPENSEKSTEAAKTASDTPSKSSEND